MNPNQINAIIAGVMGVLLFIAIAPILKDQDKRMKELGGNPFSFVGGIIFIGGVLGICILLLLKGEL